jgi:hypothetical protein
MESGKKIQKHIQSSQGGSENPLANEISSEQRELNESAHIEAEKDMDHDVDLKAHSPNDDLDEGEIARLGEDVSKII